MTKFIDLGKNEQGDHLEARIITKGDRYGLNDCLTYEDGGEPLVEFYLKRQLEWITLYGRRFVSRYYLSTLEGTSEWSSGTPATQAGLCLCGDLNISATASQVQVACITAQTHTE